MSCLFLFFSRWWLAALSRLETISRAARVLLMASLVVALFNLPVSGWAQSGGTNGLPVVSIISLDSQLTEDGAMPMRFLFTRTGATSDPLTVSYQPMGTAINGRDFERLSGRITIPAGTNAVLLSVLPTNDSLGEPSETVTLRLISSTNSFSLAILPDTQYYTGIPPGTTNSGYFGGNLAMFTKQTQWIVDHRDDWNIAFALHEGDCTENDVSAEWQNVRACLDTLNGVVPYAIAMGNHDGILNGTTLNDFRNFNQFYPLSNSVAAATVGGVFESNRFENCYHLFTAGGVDWLMFSLEFGPRNAVLDWANLVTTNYPDRKVILLTHAHVAADDTLLSAANTNHTEAPKNYGRPNDGVDVWEKFLRKHANIAFAFNGHIGHGGLGQVVGIGDHGNKVYQFACNYQFMGYGGAGFMRVLKFYPNQDRFEAQSFSPYFNQVFTDAKNQFAYTNLGIFTNLTPDYLINSFSNTATTVLVSEDLQAITANIVKVSAAGFPSRIKVRFDRAITPESATNAAHYSLTNGPAVVGAELLVDGRTVRLTPAANLNPNVQYQLVAAEILCAEPTLISNPPPVTASFTFNPVFLAADFSDGTLGDWVVVDEGNLEAGSAWQVSNGGLAQFSNIYGPGNVAAGRRGTFAYYNDSTAFGWSNYLFTTTLRSTDDDGIGVMFCYQNPQNYYKFDMDKQRNFRTLFRMLNGVETVIASQSAGYVSGSNYLLNVQVSSAGVSINLAGQALFGGLVSDASLRTGTVALYSWGNAGSFFSNITVTPFTSFPLPQISFVSPANHTQVSNTTPVNVVVSTTDPEAVGISEVEYLVNGTRVQRVFEPPYQTTLILPDGGTNLLDARLTDSLGRQSWAAPVRLNVIVIPSLLHLWRGDQGQMQMEFRVQPNTPLTLQASSNLLTWEPLGVLSNLSLTPVSILDPLATNAPARFYRVVPVTP